MVGATRPFFLILSNLTTSYLCYNLFMNDTELHYETAISENDIFLKIQEQYLGAISATGFREDASKEVIHW